VSGRYLARLLWIVLALGALAVLLAARLIVPSPSGVGSHMALGLPPCGFLLWFELPCPTCGLTTAFAHLARFQLADSLRAHPLGLPLFVATVGAVPVGLRGARQGEALSAFVDRLQLDRWALGLVVALLATWAARVAALLTR
jgi:hypothetical protein